MGLIPALTSPAHGAMMDTIPDNSPVVRLFPMIELEDGRTIGVKIRQAGREEVRLDALTPLETGMFSVLRIDDEQGESWFRAAAEIHWSHPIPGGTSVGMYLNQSLSEELLAWPDWDRRESLRYPLDVSARIWWQGSRTSAPARIANYSASGIGVVCSEPVTLGRQALIAAGTDLDSIVCVAAVPCWQVQTDEGVMIGFELEESDGKRFGGQAMSRSLTQPLDPVSPPLRLEM